MTQKVKALSRAQILCTPDAGRLRVEVPEWDGYVWVHVMSGEERDAWEMTIIKEGSKDESTENMRAKLLVLTVRDDDGKPVFTSADISSLGKKDHRTLDHIIDQSKKINRMTPKSMGELEGNSAPGRSEGRS